MNTTHSHTLSRPAHDWWRRISLSFVPGPVTPLLAKVIENLLNCAKEHGHVVRETPQQETDVILTTAQLGQPIRWRNALMFTSRRRYGLDHAPTVFTLVQATPEEFKQLMEHFRSALAKEPPDPQDFEFEGLAPGAFETLVEQGRRGGPMLSLLRTLQSQALSIRVILVVGEEDPIEAYTFDLVGAHPRTDAAVPELFYEDLISRIVTAVSTGEVTSHQVLDTPVPNETWRGLTTPAAMRKAGQELGKRSFFTQMVRVDSLAVVPTLQDAISSQYSEGCFATWDPVIKGLVTTVTGSARPVVKDNLTDDELAIIVGVRPDGRGALVRHVQGKRNDPPSSEAVELMEMDSELPAIPANVALGDRSSLSGELPVARSKLHGHRGVRAYDPKRVEHVALDKPFYYYPVSCSTEAQAQAIKTAFGRSQALKNPEDNRQVIFTVLPGHGVVIVEKWVPGKEPFEVMWEYMDAGYLRVENAVPQGPLSYVPGENGMMELVVI